ncbi:MAG: peptide-methionine (R)-S-oxide reductase MsrB [Candidatus Heimdallarchaeota archaeon]
MTKPTQRSEKEWREQLTDEQFQILRQKSTERAFTGKHWAKKDKGRYKCAGCGAPLFESSTKYDSGSGWPSFYAAIQESVATEDDRSHGMSRMEALCRRCGGHLGHIFNDGPKPTGVRYCINSAALEFESQD